MYHDIGIGLIKGGWTLDRRTSNFITGVNAVRSGITSLFFVDARTFGTFEHVLFRTWTAFFITISLEKTKIRVYQSKHGSLAYLGSAHDPFKFTSISDEWRNVHSVHGCGFNENILHLLQDNSLLKFLQSEFMNLKKFPKLLESRHSEYYKEKNQ